MLPGDLLRNWLEECGWQQLSLRTFRSLETFRAAVHSAAIVIWLL